MALRKLAGYVALAFVGVGIACGMVYEKDALWRMVNTSDRVDREKVTYEERLPKRVVGSSLEVDVTGYNIDELKEESSSNIILYKLYDKRLTKLEFIFKIKDNTLWITPKERLDTRGMYEIVLKVIDSAGDKMTLRVPFYDEKTLDKRVPSEYGIDWKLVSRNGSFAMSGYDAKGYRVMGYESSVGLERFGVRIGEMRSSVTNTYGEGMRDIEKSTKRYKLAMNGEYDMYRIDGYVVTFFYDTFESSRVRSIQWVREDVEAMKTSFYGEGSVDLRDAFEDVMVRLINDTRKLNGLGELEYDRKLNEIGRLHSQDMIKKNYFDHVNKEGLRAFERMENGGYKGRMWMSGENLAYGQMNSVFAHEGLMNSKGHRTNMLRPEYTHVGVGVSFKADGVPYWTILFYQTTESELKQ